MENRKEKKNETKKGSALPMLVLLITLGIGMIVLVRFVFLSDEGAF